MHFFSIFFPKNLVDWKNYTTFAAYLVNVLTLLVHNAGKRKRPFTTNYDKNLFNFGIDATLIEICCKVTKRKWIYQIF